MQIKPPGSGNIPITGDSAIGKRLPSTGEPNLPQAAATSVSLSPSASWVSSLQADVRSTPAVRDDVVAETKQELQDGKLEERYGDKAVDSLLAHLTFP